MNNTLFKLPGFTLIELLVAIGIMGIIATTLLLTVNPFGQIQKSRDAIRKSDLKQIQNALELYYQDNNGYPPANGVPFNGSWVSGTTTYMSKVPNDPDTSKSYFYAPDSGGYRLYASLDRISDPQICNPGGASHVCPGAVSVSAVCGEECNYGVVSPNLSP